MTEPLNDTTVEPVGEAPIGESGSVELTEPAEAVEEPADDETPISEEPELESEGERNEDTAETFTDLKTVPKELEGIAKKMQADYTKKMQRLAEQERKISEPAPTIPQEPDDEATASMKQFLSTPEGAALKNLMKEELAQEYGINELRTESYQTKAEKEIDFVVGKYGKEAIESHYDEIVEIMERYPAAPLDMVAATVLFDKAKETGKQEIRAKLQEKKENSLGAGQASSVVTPNIKVDSFEDAFRAAENSTK